MSCRGLCHRYKAGKTFAVNSRYEHGQKRCSACDIFMEWDGKHCPCCGWSLRTKPRCTKNRQQLMIAHQIKRI